MAVQKCLKMSYRGLKHSITCEPSSCYEDVIKLAIECFDIPSEYHKAILITNGNGYILKKHLFEYFTLLFPQPEITFYVRLDYSRVPEKASKPIGSGFVDTREPFEIRPQRESQRHNKRPFSEVDNSNEDLVVPLRRQNCFIGRLPISNRDEIHADSDNAVDMAYDGEATDDLGLRIFTDKRSSTNSETSNLSKRSRLMKSLTKQATNKYLKKPKPKGASLRM